MIVEITGIGYQNKGAELMFCAIAEHVLETWGDGVILAAKPTLGHDGGYRTLSRYGCHQRALLTFKGIDIGTPLGNLVPKRVLRSYGVIAEKEVNVVLDASGLRYSDQWGYRLLKEALRQYKRVKQRGGKIILMPQAFGPFQDPSIREGMKDLHGIVDRIYTRDAVSHRMLCEVVGESDKIRRGPDFTGLFVGEEVADSERFKGKIAVIPNRRMLDKTSSVVSENYFVMLLHVIRRCRAAGWEVFVLNHEAAGDAELCEKIASAFEPKLEYSGVRSAKEVKGIIGVSSGIITSRFHGLVSGLMQGIPAVATSWSHKYEELLDLFGAEEYLIDLEKTEEQWDQICDKWMAEALPADSDSRSEYLNRAELQKQEIRLLWADIRQLINSCR